METYRKLGNMAFVYTVRLLFGGRYTDLCYGYNAFWRRVLPQLQLDGQGFEIETMMNVRALKAGLIVAEVPSFESHRIHGERAICAPSRTASGSCARSSGSASVPPPWTHGAPWR